MYQRLDSVLRIAVAGGRLVDIFCCGAVCWVEYNLRFCLQVVAVALLDRQKIFCTIFVRNWIEATSIYFSTVFSCNELSTICVRNWMDHGCEFILKYAFPATLELNFVRNWHKATMIFLFFNTVTMLECVAVFSFLRPTRSIELVWFFFLGFPSACVTTPTVHHHCGEDDIDLKQHIFSLGRGEVVQPRPDQKYIFVLKDLCVTIFKIYRVLLKGVYFHTILE